MVADGMGGHAGGAVASKVAVEAFVHAIEQGGGLADGLRRPMLRSAGPPPANPSLPGMGATLVAAQVRGDEVRWISVGDSPFFLVSSGSIEQLNADHSMAPQIDALVKRGVLTADEAEHHPGRHTLREAVMGQPLSLIDKGSRKLGPDVKLLLCSDGVQSLSEAEIAANAIKPVDGLVKAVLATAKEHQDNITGDQAGARAMSKSVVIEVTRGPVVESRHEGIAAIVQPDGAVVASWGDIDSLILPRSANKPIQAMAFVESGAVERFGLGNEHIALACASHSGEKRHVETVQAWLAKVGLSEADLECGTHAPRLQGTIEELARAGRMPTPAFNNCSGKHSGFLTTAVQYGEPTKDYIKYNHPVQRRLREIMTDLCGTDANAFPYGTDGCGIPTLATPLKSLARAMASMADPSRLSNKHAEAAGRIRAAISAEPFMMAGTGRFCTRINAALPGVAQIKTGAEGVFCGMLPTLGFGVAIKMWDGAARAAEVAMATLLDHLGVLPASQREEIMHPPVKNVVGLLVGEMRPAKSWLG